MWGSCVCVGMVTCVLSFLVVDTYTIIMPQLTAECEQLMIKGHNAFTSRHIPFAGRSSDMCPRHELMIARP